MKRQFAVVHEAGADFETGTKLADRVLAETIGVSHGEALHATREWIREAPHGSSLTWKNIPKLASNARIRAHGHFDGQPGKADAAAARKAMLYLHHAVPDLAGIVLLRDSDNDEERRRGLNQARETAAHKTPVVIGLAVVERECWVLAGFEPQNPEEQRRHAEERQHLGFDPCLRSHELTACKDDQAKRSSKRSLTVLSGGDRDRERRCWTETGLSLLRTRGVNNGLAEYLDDVRDRLAPLITQDGR